MKKNILIAEDDRAIIEVVKIILENEGYIVTATDREEAIYEALKDPFSFIYIFGAMCTTPFCIAAGCI